MCIRDRYDLYCSIVKLDLSLTPGQIFENFRGSDSEIILSKIISHDYVIEETNVNKLFRDIILKINKTLAQKDIDEYIKKSRDGTLSDDEQKILAKLIIKQKKMSNYIE